MRVLRVSIVKDEWKSCNSSPLAKLLESLESLEPGDVLEIYAEEDYLPLETLIFILKKRRRFRVLEVQRSAQVFIARIERSDSG
ncbi:MAG: hypothetical protein QXS85_00080 [Acidilobaceae archaeon]